MKARGLLELAGFGAGAALVIGRRRRAERRIDFTDRVVVITGGSRGLGLTMARELSREGARLVLMARNPAEMEEARRQLERNDATVATILCDVTSRIQVKDAMNLVLARFGRIDVLINIAGTIQFGPLEHMSRADFEDAMKVHLWGPFHTMSEVIPVMARQGQGRIVNVSSVGGMIALPHMAPYCASKFALVGLSDAVRAELRRVGIRVTTVCPGLMRTGSHVNAMFKGKHEAEYAWFSISNALPFASVSARRAARRIIDACRHGDAHLTIGLPARIAIMANAVFPKVTAELVALLCRLLPSPTDRASGNELRPGWASVSRWAPSLLTYRSDRATVPGNELRGHSPSQS